MRNAVLQEKILIKMMQGLNGCLSREQEVRCLFFRRVGGLLNYQQHYYRTQTIARRSPTENRPRGNMFASQSSRSGPVPPPRPRSTDPRVDARTNPSPQSSRPPMPNFRTSDPYQNQNQNPHYPRPMSPRQERPPPINTTWSPPYGTMPRPRPGESSPPPQPRWQTRPQSPPPPPADFLRPTTPGRNRSRSVPSSEAPPIPNQQRPSQPPPPPPPLSPRPRASNSVPLLSSLLDRSKQDVSALNVATLKAILQANHVNARLILEKSELVEKVMSLIEIERRDRAREQAIHEAEERAAMDAQKRRMEQMRMNGENRGEGSSPVPPNPPSANNIFVERDGLCVVCQDEEANVAIVDCGYVFPSFLLIAFLTIVKSSRSMYGMFGRDHEIYERMSPMPYPHSHRAETLEDLQVVDSKLVPPIIILYMLVN